MPGHLQEGFGCVVTNRFDQLFDDEEDPFEVLKQAETKKKDAAAPGAAKTAAQAAKQPRKESQKDRKVAAPEKKEETTAPVPLKKEGERGGFGGFLALGEFVHIFHSLCTFFSSLLKHGASEHIHTSARAPASHEVLPLHFPVKS